MKIPIPDYAKDMHTKVGKAEGKDYLHFLEESSKVENIKEGKNTKYKEELLDYAKKDIFPKYPY